MSEMSRAARRAMRAKIHRITQATSGKVDASDYGPEEVLNANVKTGLRPISRRAYKKGGKVVAVEGKDAKKHAGKKPRTNGSKHLTVDALVNRNYKDANEAREGIKHIGGLKRGGRAGKAAGGSPDAGVPKERFGFSPSNKGRVAESLGFKKGGRTRKEGGGGLERLPTTPTAERDTMGSRELELLRRSAAEDARNQFTSSTPIVVKGRTPTKIPPAPVKRISTPVKAPKELPFPTTYRGRNITIPIDDEAKPRKRGGKTWEGSAKDEAQDKKLAKKYGMSMKEWEASSKDKKHDKQKSMKGLKSGGLAMDGEYQGTRPTGGRIAKRDGGSLAGLEMNKGGRAKRKGNGKTDINIVISTGKGNQPMPTGMGPGAAPIPIPVPPMGAGAGAAMAPSMPSPQAAAGALGGGSPVPLARKRGGRTYRSYKDMDAGAGSGLGRLEKTEIQKHKR